MSSTHLAFAPVLFNNLVKVSNKVSRILQVIIFPKVLCHDCSLLSAPDRSTAGTASLPSVTAIHINEYDDAASQRHRVLLRSE